MQLTFVALHVAVVDPDATALRKREEIAIRLGNTDRSFDLKHSAQVKPTLEQLGLSNCSDRHALKLLLQPQGLTDAALLETVTRVVKLGDALSCDQFVEPRFLQRLLGG